ncbi:MAG: hypothetical protein AB1Z98_00030 [Nannocystaceae bacterium]
MPGFPLTAWAVDFPWGDDVDVALDRLRDEAEPLFEPRTVEPTAIIERMGSACARACSRFGRSRVAVVLGSTATPETSEALLRAVQERTTITGPAYCVAAAGIGGAKAVVSAEYLLRATIADAVVVGGIDEHGGALILIEKHGDAFVRLAAVSESTDPGNAESQGPSAAERALTRAHDQGRPQPLGYLHLHAAPSSSNHHAQRRIAQTVLGSAPHCTTPTVLRATGAAAGALETVLAAASLVRGYTPQPRPAELEHDRVIVHAAGDDGHHVALMLEART